MRDNAKEKNASYGTGCNLISELPRDGACIKALGVLQAEFNVHVHDRHQAPQAEEEGP